MTVQRRDEAPACVPSPSRMTTHVRSYQSHLIKATSTSWWVRLTQLHPSLFLEYLVVKTHKRLYELLPQYRIEGHRNIWIVKPGYDARGHNIFLIKDLREILQVGKTVHSPKIV